jgi:hypothetical protein
LDSSFFLFKFYFILKNAKKGAIPTYEHDDTLYLNKREQMKYNVQNRPDVDARTQLPSRHRMMNPKFYDSMSKYNAHMLARYND